MGYIAYYNYVWHPFSGFDKEVLVNYENNEKIDCDILFEEFFIKYVDYTQYEERYNTDFYFNYRDLICPVLSTAFFRELPGTVEGFSCIIKPDVEYESLKKELSDKIDFVATPIGESHACYY